MKNNFNFRKGFMPIILILNVILVILLSGLLIANAKFAINIFKDKSPLSDLKTQLTDTQNKWFDLENNRQEKYQYILNWHEDDKKYFHGFLEDRANSKNNLYNEYIALNRKLSELEKKAYHDPKGYILYNPVLSEAYNALSLAVNARARLLTGNPYKGAINRDSLESYYSEFDNYYKDLYGFIETTSPSIKNMEYNQEKVIEMINNLPISDNYLNRLRIFFLDKSSLEAGGVTLSNLYGQNCIVIFNNSGKIDHSIENLTHEIGHLVGNDILGEFKSLNDYFTGLQRDEKAMGEYAQIYGKTQYNIGYTLGNRDQWNNSLIENFAEDFANIYIGKEKISSWEGDHQVEVRAFIEEKVKQTNSRNLPKFKGAKIIFNDDNSGFEATLREEALNIFYTKENVVTIQFEDLNKNDRKIEAYMGLSHKGQLNLAGHLNNENQLQLTFPSKGEYVISILSDVPNSSLSLEYYRLLVTYDP